jgi:hypothetical protein
MSISVSLFTRCQLMFEEWWRCCQERAFCCGAAVTSAHLRGVALCAPCRQIQRSACFYIASGAADAIVAIGAVLGAQARSSRSQ